jgi:hemolysin type calcium-binding protein/List-Bact-rpt repeat protein
MKQRIFRMATGLGARSANRRARGIVVSAFVVCACLYAPPSRAAEGLNTLTIERGGTGIGTVVSLPEGIDCGLDCSEAFHAGETVKLTAAPAPHSLFIGWTDGGCSGTGPCEITMSDATSVMATFDLEYWALEIARFGPGGGSVVSVPAGITCGGDCLEGYLDGTVVTLTATPDATSSFTGWKGGGCSQTGTCKVRLKSDATIKARFAISDDCTIVGTDGNDVLIGTSLDDIICGLNGKDVIWGLRGEDVLIGGYGRDVLVPGGGNDVIKGSDGFDTASYQKISPWLTARFVVSVDLKAGRASGKVHGHDRLWGVEGVIGTRRGDVLLGSSLADRLVGGAGADTIKGGRRADVLIGSGGDDVIRGGRGDDTIWGGHGDDRLYGGGGFDRIRGGPGRNRIFGSDSPA